MTKRVHNCPEQRLGIATPCFLQLLQDAETSEGSGQHGEMESGKTGASVRVKGLKSCLLSVASGEIPRLCAHESSQLCPPLAIN